MNMSTNPRLLRMKELILLFHGLGQPHNGVDPEERPYWLSTSSFRSLLDQVVDCSTNSDLKISITFDDGNATDASLALPELSKRGIFATFFVCAGRIEKKHYLDKILMKDLLEAGMSIGSHGMDHRDWRNLDSLALEVEISDARRKLEDVIQRPVTTLAIPFGSYNRRILSRVMRDPWECVYTSDRGHARSLAKIKPRETVDITMLGECLIRKLAANPSLAMRMRGGLSRFYKRLR